jgi:hypothetical protein
VSAYIVVHGHVVTISIVLVDRWTVRLRMGLAMELGLLADVAHVECRGNVVSSSAYI